MKNSSQRKLTCLKKLTGILLVTVTLGIMNAHASYVDFGVSSPKTGASCAPFGCMGYYGPTQTYQQVYLGSQFGVDPVRISSIMFFNSQSNSEFNSGDYSISFSTTQNAPNGLDDNLLANVGVDSAVFYSAHLSGLVGSDIVAFDGTDFLFDPTKGNLLMTVSATNLTEQIYAYFDIYKDDTSSRAFTAYPLYSDVI